MRRVFFAAALAVGLAAFLGPSRAYAFGDERLVADVPFAFQVEGVKLPPGEYVIEQAGTNEPNVVTIEARDSGRKLLFLTENAYPARSPKAPEMVFDGYGSQRFLRAIWLTDASGARFGVATDELRAVREANRKNPAPESTR